MRYFGIISFCTGKLCSHLLRYAYKKQQERFTTISSSKTKRIQILSESEINELYALPNFSRQERDDYFSLDNETQKLVNELRRTETRVYFILLLGYFRSRPIVFNFSFDLVSNIEPIEE
ncbi:DUF4158 domain-containing protein [Pseudoalteromonas sp. S201]|nr:DUF4158 domain-containing protein [Pseudoalteromonas sp. S201]